MTENRDAEQNKQTTQHPEQRRQQETGHEDATSPDEVGQPPWGTPQSQKPGQAA